MIRFFRLLMGRVLSLIPGVRLYPRILQFPITGKCNSACMTCSVPSRAPNVEMTAERVREILKNDLFKKVESVGINGGEPTLVPELPEVVAELLRLPKLKAIHMISNGSLTDRLLSVIQKIRALCEERRIVFSLSLSLDGVGPVYRACRGIPAFDQVISSIDQILAFPNKYCHQFSVGCTVSRYNADFLAELDTFCVERGIPVFYRLAVPNRRIHNLHYSDEFSVLSSDAARQSAMEFFFGKVIDKTDRNWQQKFTYYSIYRYLEQKGHVRLADCFWQWRDATVDESGKIYYCATQSKSLGLLDSSNAAKLFHSKENRQYRKELIEEHCQHCIHYAFAPTIKGAFSFLLFFVHLLVFPSRYRFFRRGR
ncbi:radical SAM protein [Tichowtungia aerotolerans]|uniref:Radical SAM protein n=1 Tax=Tichowtungia aerotolerans TaxID=2697043 RepID=A0A6P1M2L2_9BACT|nr:radical SAM protein [Tichowtungia aerotolerans]QHI68067.1 radical SAM protein [Tichowtungia aerotolerans]